MLNFLYLLINLLLESARIFEFELQSIIDWYSSYSFYSNLLLRRVKFDLFCILIKLFYSPALFLKIESVICIFDLISKICSNYPSLVIELEFSENSTF